MHYIFNNGRFVNENFHSCTLFLDFCFKTPVFKSIYNTSTWYRRVLTFPTSVIAFQLQWFSKLIENFRTSTVDTFQNHSFQFHLEPSDFKVFDFLSFPTVISNYIEHPVSIMAIHFWYGHFLNMYVGKIQSKIGTPNFGAQE